MTTQVKERGGYMDFTAAMREYIACEIRAMQALDLEEINCCINMILKVRERGGTIYTMGNGGSAATASHFVCDFAKGVSGALKGKKFMFECLSDNTPIVTAIANDICYEEVFRYQLLDKLKPEDLVIGISGSGNSENVVRAMKYARTIGTPVIGVTGYDGGRVKELSDHVMHVDLADMQIVEDIHMLFDHMVMRVLCKLNTEE